MKPNELPLIARALLLELSAIILIAKTKTDPSLYDEEDERPLDIYDSHLKFFWRDFSDNDHKILLRLAENINISEFFSNFFESNSTIVLTCYDKNLYIDFLPDDMDDDDWETNSTADNGKEKLFIPLLNVNSDIIDLLLKDEELMNDKDFRADLVAEISKGGYDIFNITPEISEQIALSFPIIRRIILEQSINYIISSKFNTIATWDNKYKKLILSEVMRLAIEQALYTEEEQYLIEVMFNAMDVDLEYMDEFKEILLKIAQHNAELNTLINE